MTPRPFPHRLSTMTYYLLHIQFGDDEPYEAKLGADTAQMGVDFYDYLQTLTPAQQQAALAALLENLQWTYYDRILPTPPTFGSVTTE